MQSPINFLCLAGAAVLMISCATDNATSPVGSSEAAAALVSAPITFDQVNSSFVGGSSANDAFTPIGPGGGEQNRRGPGWGAFMGGGIGEAFIGGIGFGRGFGRGPFGEWKREEHDSDNCAFSTTSNRLECKIVRENGLTINRSFSFLDASGAVQQAFDTATTNTVNVKTTVSGTITHHETATSTVNVSSDFTVTGLASSSTQRTVNGTSAGTESTTGTKKDVAFTASRIAGDTITGVVIPLQDGRPTYPTAGTVVRSMQATVTLSGASPSTSSRREVVTYDGSATAKVVITQDGVTKNCTKPLPHGRLTCT
ncbi:MAG TPA: hypothetical protein VGJ62_02235 [Gemmatimonadaceae bacterium]|jgi:hypothetical protein